VTKRTAAVTDGRALGQGRLTARELRAAGARLFVSDTDEARVRRAVEECEAEAVAPREIYSVGADIFAPCALGGVLNDETIPRLRVEVVAGAANNQLLEARHGDALAARGVLTLLNIFHIARAESVPPHVAADRLAEERLNAKRQK
jgi:leucine dehydrogenase